MSEFVRRTVGKAAFPLALMFCLFNSWLIFANYFHMGKFSRDFGVYWRAANQPLSEIYFWQGPFPFPYAPTMLLWIEPLSAIPRWPAYFLFIGLSIGAFAWAFRRYASGLAITLAMISPPFARGIFTGQVCALMAALTVWACGTANRIGAGIAFGVIATIKPQLVLMAPLMLALNRDWKAFVAAGSTFVSVVLLSLVLYGPERWPEWVASMGHFHSAVAGTNIIQIATTPASIAERFGYPPLPFMALGTAFGAWLVYLHRDSEPLEKTAALTIGSLMAAPYALAYDLAAVMPLMAMLVLRGRILAALGMATHAHPLPLVISTGELLAGKLKSWRLRYAS